VEEEPEEEVMGEDDLPPAYDEHFCGRCGLQVKTDGIEALGKRWYVVVYSLSLFSLPLALSHSFLSFFLFLQIGIKSVSIVRCATKASLVHSSATTAFRIAMMITTNCLARNVLSVSE
jgi:hypothetical protein